MGDGILSCPLCGGTAIPAAAQRSLQRLAEPGEVLGGRFRVEKILGTGASGVVYGVVDSMLQGEVALKVLWERASAGDPAFERLRREIRAAQKARHPGVIAVNDIILLDDHPALVMEWVDGATLRESVRNSGHFGAERATAVAAKILDALSHLHSLGIVHRDLKSGNILMDKDGNPKLGDFGLAKGQDLGLSLTATGSVLGTPGYMAPEVIEGGTATVRSDLYSFGVVLFEMLTGRLPYEGSSGLEVASRQIKEPPQLEPLKEKGIPTWLRKVVGRLLERDPGDRFDSAAEVLSALGRRSPGFSIRRRWKVRTAVALALLLSLAGAAAYLYRRSIEVPLTLTYTGKTLQASDPGGKSLWSMELPREIQSVCYGRFGPGGSPAVACAIYWDRSKDENSLNEEHHNKVMLFDRSGRPTGQVDVSMIANTLEQHYFVTLSAHEFSRGAGESLVMLVRHAAWHPTGLRVYSPESLLMQRDKNKALPVVDIYNSGGFTPGAYMDTDGDGVDEIAYYGVNMGLYWANFVALAKVGPPKCLTTVSPDCTWIEQWQSPELYRCYSYLPYASIRASRPAGAAGMEISLPGIEPWVLGTDRTLRRGGVEVGPGPDDLSHINSLLPKICYLRERRMFGGMVEELARWPDGLPQPYGWMGKLFLSHALMGMGRYAEAEKLLQDESRRSDGPPPLHYYQKLADALFLSGSYDRCSAFYDSVPAEVRPSKPELGRTALWADIYRADPMVEQHYFQDPSAVLYTWDRALFRGILQYLQGDYDGACTTLAFESQNPTYDTPDIGLWLADSHAMAGRLAEASGVMKMVFERFPRLKTEGCLTDLWIRWRGGERGDNIVSKMEAYIEKNRIEAKTDVEARALLPLSLTKLASVLRDSGRTAEAAKLAAEAARLAPKGWQNLYPKMR